MTDDLVSADHSAETEDARSHEKTKRGRLKGAINRTRFMITEARKHTSHSDKHTPGTSDENDLDAFLAAGRVSNASSSHLSTFSETASNENPSAHNDRSTPPRPSTSDYKSQPSPRHMSVPRIDVSASQRFPNAKEIRNDGPVELPGSSAPTSASTINSTLLKPEYKSRSQSTSSLASPGRKARIRGLSVGFANTPPVVIGEGGDEAEAPTVEISRAKMRRARSASPQVRNHRPGADVPSENTRRISGREDNDNSVDVFNPKPVSRVQTGALPTSPQSSTEYDTFVPKPLIRHQTGLSDTINPAIAHRPPPLPARNKPFLPPDLGRSQKVTLDLTKEFEMSLGLQSPNSATQNSPDAQGPRILAPKPQRAPPSYDLIEGGGREHGHDPKIVSPGRQSPARNPQLRASKEQSPQQNHRPPQQALRQTGQQSSQKQMSIIHELPSPQENTNLSTIRHPPAGPQEGWQDLQAPQVQPSQRASVSQQNQQSQIPQRIEQRVLPQTKQRFPQTILQQHQVRQSSQSPRLESPQNSSASQLNQQYQILQRSEHPFSQSIAQPISQPVPQRVEQQLSQSTDQQQQVSNYRFSQHLELPAEPVQQTISHEHGQRNYPEFENFLRSSMLPEEEDSRPNPKLSRFASLHTSTVRRTPNSSQERLSFYDQPPTSNTRMLPPLDTSSGQDTFHSFTQRSKPNPRPTSLYGTPSVGTPHSTIRRVSPSGHHDSGSSNYSSAVQSPHSGAEPMTNRMRFYESINKGNPPAGYI